METIHYLTYIEKRDWNLFRDSPHYMFGHFIYHNLNRYPKLKSSINKNNCHFEFIYEYLTDQSELVDTICYYNGLPITESDYKLYAYYKDYRETWVMIEPKSCKTLLFFEYEHRYAKTTTFRS